MIFTILLLIAGLIVLPIFITYIDRKEQQRFEQLYGNLTAKEVIDLFYEE